MTRPWKVNARATGTRVKQLREEHGLAQRELEFPGVSYAYISRVENGARTPSLAALIGIAERLDTTALYLATGDADGPCPCCGRGPKVSSATGVDGKPTNEGSTK